jgi:DNA-directed RNA polymerase subunit M/transcription elongation factor TFIIS
MICTKCGAEMHQTDKNTFTGRVIREYECRSCGHTDWQDEGVALWQVLHDAAEQDKAEAAARSAENAVLSHPDPPQPTPQAPASLWRRLTRRIRGEQ